MKAMRSKAPLEISEIFIDEAETQDAPTKLRRNNKSRKALTTQSHNNAANAPAGRQTLKRSKNASLVSAAPKRKPRRHKDSYPDIEHAHPGGGNTWIPPALFADAQRIGRAMNKPQVLRGAGVAPQMKPVVHMIEDDGEAFLEFDDDEFEDLLMIDEGDIQIGLFE